MNAIERRNRVIGTAIISYIDQNYRNCYNDVSRIGFATIYHSTGFAPTFLNYGRPIVPHVSLHPKIDDLTDVDFENFRPNSSRG